jgi:hypothetical protein
MSDVRRRKNRSPKTIQPVNETKPVANEIVQEVHVDAWSIFGRAATVAALALLVGFILTFVSTMVYDFKNLPNTGRIQYDSTSKQQTFYSHYPTLRKFAILENSLKPTAETQFTKIGSIGTGFFVFSVINTFHWIMEIGFGCLGGMILIPIFVLIIGSSIFFFNLLPYSMQKSSNALPVGIGISMLHSFMLLVLFFIVLQVFPAYNALFKSPYFYSGDVIMTTTRAGAPILLLTGFTYGTIAGGVLYFMIYAKAFILNQAVIK